MRILLSALRAAGACADQVELFVARFGDGVDVTEVLCLSVADLFDWDWAAENLLPAPARAEYWRAMRITMAQFDVPKLLAWDEYLSADEYQRAAEAVALAYQRAAAAAFARAAIGGSTP